MPTWRTTVEAEHALLGLDGTPTFLATHFSDGGVLVTAQWASGAVDVLGAEGAPPASVAAVGEAHRERRSGRLVRFPGAETVTGTITVGRLLQGTAIDDVVMVGHREPVAPDAPIDLQGFVRPQFTQGRVVLVVRPAAGGLVVPFEQPDPTACCADH